MQINDLLIRPIRQEDLSHILWSEEAKELNEFFQEIFELTKKGNFFFFIGELQGQIVGRIRLVPLAIDGNAWIAGLAVKPEFQQKGIGTQLIRRAETIVKLLDKKSVVLTVEIENKKALRLYEHLGYKIIRKGTQKWSYPKNEKRIERIDEVYFLEKNFM